MTEQNEKDKEYLLGICKLKLSKDNPFIIHTENNEEMLVISPSSSAFANELDTISKYKTLYDTVIDLITKITFSLQNAIEDAYSDDVLNQFDFIYTGGQREWSAYYNIENALFRIEALWDILAQIVNVKYRLEDDIKDVYHNRIFSKQEKWTRKYWESGLPSEIELIANYLMEEDNTDIIDGMWKGNYSYVNSLRNDMTHKFSISQSAFSSYALSLKVHPIIIIKRVAECFATLQNFIYEVCENITE